jgi:hypothetical protein
LLEEGVAQAIYGGIKIYKIDPGNHKKELISDHHAAL